MPSILEFSITFTSVTKLPIIVKGIMTSEDAELACSFGVAGVFVSVLS